MRNTVKKILAFIFALLMFATNLSGTGLIALAIGKYITLTKDVRFGDGRTYTVKVTYDRSSGLPENALLAVSEPEDEAPYIEESLSRVSNSFEEVLFSKAFDISIVDRDTGEKYQPTEAVTVSIGLPGVDLKQNKIKIVHFGDTTEVLSGSAKRKSVEFTTRGFSIFVVVIGSSDPDENPPMRTYSFYTLDENEQYVQYMFTTYQGYRTYQQTIKGNEKPVSPQLPAHSTKTFRGWYTRDNNGFSAEPYDFDDAPAVTVTEEVKLYAVFDNFLYAIFYDQYNGSSRSFPVIATKREVALNGRAKIKITDLEVAYDDSISNDPNDTNPTVVSTMMFYGWSYVKVETPGADTGIGPDGNPAPAEIIIPDSNGEIEITETTKLYPIFITVHWLNFYTAEAAQGADYFAPIYYTEAEGESEFGSQTAADGKHPLYDLLPSRPGYSFAGWYTGEKVYSSGNIFDHVEYGTKIVNANGSLNLTGNFGGDPYAESGSMINDGGALKLKKDITLFAKWEVGSANYTVVIWKQNVSGDGYDFAASFSNSATTDTEVGFTGSNASYLNYTGQPSPISYGGSTVSFVGFHLDHYDDAKNVNGNGSTIINVYYNRDWMVINFQANGYNLSSIGGTTQYNYTPTTGNNEPQYGVVNGEFVELRRTGTAPNYVWGIPEYEYVYTPSTAEDDVMYGYVNGEYVEIERRVASSTTTEAWTYSNTSYSLSPSSSTSNGTYYTLYNGNYVELVRETSWGWGSWTRYTYNTTTSNGNNTYYGLVEDENGNSVFVRIYRRGSNGSRYYTLTDNDNGVVYTGTRYTRGNGSTVSSPSNYYTLAQNTTAGVFYPNSSTRYTKGSGDNPSFNPTDSTTGTLYGLVGTNLYAQLTHTENTTYTYAYYYNGEVYDGTRYTRNLQETGNYIPYNGTRFTRGSSFTGLQWIGLYGQTFDQTGYAWNTVSTFRWREGVNSGTYQTLLDGFVQSANPYNLYCQGNSGTGEYRHYKQNVDGSYSTTNVYIAHSSNSSPNFTFSNKFDGFTVYAYSTSNEGFQSTGGTHLISVGDNVSGGSFPLYIYHIRNTYSIRFLNSINNNELSTGTRIFGEDLSALDSYMPDESTWPNGMSFNGWYADAQAKTTRVFFHQPTSAEIAALGSGVSYTVYDTMPAGGFQLYAGWLANDYLVTIDPAGGNLTESESTWFFATYGDPEDGIIQVYDDVTRNFIEVADPGTETPYYYCEHNREYWYRYYGWTGPIPDDRNEEFAEPFMPTRNGSPVDCNGPYATPRAFEKGVYTATGTRLIPERRAYYTTDESLSTDGKMYIFSPGAYRFSGWYEVDLNSPNRDETIYHNESREYVDHVTYLVAHWKQVGTYIITYDTLGRGQLDQEDSNADTFLFLEDSTDYADKANVIVTRSVNVNTDQHVNFIGWSIRGDKSGKVYVPGELMVFPARYAEKNEERDRYILTLEAVYTRIDSVTLTYDANGGEFYDVDSNTVVDTADFSFGRSLDTDPAAPRVTEILDTDAQTATVTGMRNNTGFVLSDGTGLRNGYTDPTLGTYTEYVFSGWNTEPDGSGQHFDLGAYDDGTHMVYLDLDYYPSGSPKPIVLYAEWRVKVWFDKNRFESDWGGDWTTHTDSNGDQVYYYDSEKGMYYQEIYLNSVIDEPPFTPWDTNASSASFDGPIMNFAYWSDVKYSDNEATAKPYDFSKPVTDQMTLYGFWRSPIQVPYHIADSSHETIVQKDDWYADPSKPYFSVTVGTSIALSSDPTAYTNVPTTPPYGYAFACLSDGVAHIDGGNRITRVFYDTTQRMAAVEFTDGTTRVLASRMEIYLVYFYDPLILDIGYVHMLTDGTLTDITNDITDTNAPKQAQIPSNTPYTMGASVTQPLYWAQHGTPAHTNYKYYAFAIGDENAADGSRLNLLTPVATSDGSRPALMLRGGWRGLEYSLDNGTTWLSAGYERKLYVVYFEAKPTLITLSELTVGTRADAQEEFTFQVLIQEKVGTGSFDEGTGHMYYLKSGEERTFTIFYTPAGDGNPEIVQRITITELPTAQQAEDFTTDKSEEGGAYVANAPYQFTTTSSSTAGSVTFRNTRKQQEIELHIAYIDANGYTEDDTHRTTDTSVYDIIIPIGQDVTVSGKQDVIFVNNPDNEFVYSGKMIYGMLNPDGTIAYRGDVTGTVSFKDLGDGYYGLYLDGDQTKVLEDYYNIYYVFYRMPRIYYVKESGTGALSVLTNPLQAGDPPATITQLGTSTPISNGQFLPMSTNGSSFLISQVDEYGRNWMMANFLNESTRINALRYHRLGVGTQGATASGQLQVVSTEDLSMELKVMDGQVQYSYNGTDWSGFVGAPAVYAIYRERGCDLHIKLVVEDPSEQTVPHNIIVYSPTITEAHYTIAGYGDVTSIDADTSAHTITLENVRHGDEIVISGMQTGSYTVTEILDLERLEVIMTLDGTEIEVTCTNNAGTTDDTAVSHEFSIVTTTDISKTVVITNKLGSVEVSFKKIDGFGSGLNGAVFALYKDVGCNDPFTVSGTQVTATSATVAGVAGTVDFGRLPTGRYYMKETPPAGYTNAKEYILVVGERELANLTGSLSAVTDAQIAAQTGNGARKFAIFLINSSTGGAMAATDNHEAPDIARYGVLNESQSTRKVILAKTDTLFNRLKNATFRMYRCDMTVVHSVAIGGGPAVTFTSGASGVFFIDYLPFGTYYLLETGYPEGTTTPPSGAEGWWYTITVDANGVTVTDQSPTAP